MQLCVRDCICACKYVGLYINMRRNIYIKAYMHIYMYIYIRNLLLFYNFQLTMLFLMYLFNCMVV